MAKPLVSDELWRLVEPLIPKVERRYRFPGRRRVDDRSVLTGIVFVLQTGSGGSTCRRRWAVGRDDVLAAAEGVAGGGRLAAAARGSAREAERSRPDRLVAGGDRQLARARRWGGEKTCQSPVDRARRGSKHHTVTCGRGIPLALSLTAGNHNDILQLLPLIDAIPAVRGKRGRPRRRPDRLLGDSAYRSRRHRQELRARRISVGSRGRDNHTAQGSANSGGCRAHDRLAAPVPPPPRPLRTPRRHPRSVPPDRRLPDLPETPQPGTLILLGALSEVCVSIRP